MLLEALDTYEASRNAEPNAYPRLVCVITGKGPLKEHYRVHCEYQERAKRACFCYVYREGILWNISNI